MSDLPSPFIPSSFHELLENEATLRILGDTKLGELIFTEKDQVEVHSLPFVFRAGEIFIAGDNTLIAREMRIHAIFTVQGDYLASENALPIWGSVHCEGEMMPLFAQEEQEEIKFLFEQKYADAAFIHQKSFPVLLLQCNQIAGYATMPLDRILQNEM